jgi:hypothetical protein
MQRAPTRFSELEPFPELTFLRISSRESNIPIGDIRRDGTGGAIELVDPEVDAVGKALRELANYIDYLENEKLFEIESHVRDRRSE